MSVNMITFYKYSVLMIFLFEFSQSAIYYTEIKRHLLKEFKNELISSKQFEKKLLSAHETSIVAISSQYVNDAVANQISLHKEVERIIKSYEKHGKQAIKCLSTYSESIKYIPKELIEQSMECFSTALQEATFLTAKIKDLVKAIREWRNGVKFIASKCADETGGDVLLASKCFGDSISKESFDKSIDSYKEENGLLNENKLNITKNLSVCMMDKMHEAKINLDHLSEELAVCSSH